MKKRWLIPLLALLCLLLAGCAAEESVQPGPSPSMTPEETTMQPTESPTQEPASPDNPSSMTDANAAPGVTSAAQAKKVSTELEAELVRLSEVTDAQAVVAGHMAMVALQTDSQYQGGVDDRIRTMVKERLDGIVSGINKLEVTDDSDLFDELKTLGDKLDGEADMGDIENELSALMERTAE